MLGRGPATWGPVRIRRRRRAAAGLSQGSKKRRRRLVHARTAYQRRPDAAGGRCGFCKIWHVHCHR